MFQNFLRFQFKLGFFPRAHWYLAVICFPGLDGPMFEQNPLYHGPIPASTLASDTQSEENIPDHCRPLSPDRDGLDSSSEQLSPGVPEASGESDGDFIKENSAFAEGGQEPSNKVSGTGQTDTEQQYMSKSDTWWHANIKNLSWLGYQQFLCGKKV